MNILLHTEDEIHVKGQNRILKFWIHGTGLIPLHRNPSIVEDGEYRIEIKELLFKNKRPKRKTNKT